MTLTTAKRESMIACYMRFMGSYGVEAVPDFGDIPFKKKDIFVMRGHKRRPRFIHRTPEDDNKTCMTHSSQHNVH